MLNEKQIKSIEMLINGEYQMQEIAKTLGIHRSTLHGWRTNNEEYIKEYEKRLLERTRSVSQKFNERLDTAIESLYDIITNPKVATRERKDACIFWINRVLGTPTSKMEMVDDNKDNNIDEEDILKDIAKVEDDKVINIAK